MSKIKFENGVVVNFNGIPTQKDIEEVAQKLNIKKQPTETESLLAPTVPKEKTLIEKIGDFTGLTALGKGAGLMAFKYLSPEGIDLQNKVKNGTASKYELKAYYDIFSQTPSSKELLSSAGQTAIAIGTAGLSIPSSLAGKVAQAGAISGGLGGLQAFGEGKDTGEIAKQATKSAIVGGATMGALDLAGKGISKVINKIPETAWSSILKRTPTVASKNPQLEKQLSKTGVIGTSRSSLSNKFGKEIQNIELNISGVLEGKEGNIPTKNIISNLESLKKTYSQIPGEESSVSAIENIQKELISKYGENIDRIVGNNLKKNIYQLIQNSYKKGLLEIPAKTESQKIIARSLKQEIEKIAPETIPLNQREAIFVQAKKAIDKTIARQTGKGVLGTGIGGYDILTGIGSGLFTGNPVVALGAIGAKKLGESPAVLSTVSAGATKLIDIFNDLSPTQKVLFYTGLRGLVTESSK
jgi:hypothetical protein